MMRSMSTVLNVFDLSLKYLPLFVAASQAYFLWRYRRPHVQVTLEAGTHMYDGNDMGKVVTARLYNDGPAAVWVESFKLDGDQSVDYRDAIRIEPHSGLLVHFNAEDLEVNTLAGTSTPMWGQAVLTDGRRIRSKRPLTWKQIQTSPTVYNE